MAVDPDYPAQESSHGAEVRKRDWAHCWAFPKHEQAHENRKLLNGLSAKWAVQINQQSILMGVAYDKCSLLIVSALDKSVC